VAPRARSEAGGTPPRGGSGPKEPAGAGPGAVARPQLLVISGPSGAGKSSLADRLLVDPRFGRALTATTRKPREGEVNDVHYRFLTDSEFRSGLSRGAFLEHAEVYGRLYGTPRETPEAVLSSGRHCVLVIDVQGAASIKRVVPGAKFVFVKAPSVAELRRRLSTRALDGPEAMERRLAVVERELAEAPTFDLVVVNDDLERTARQIAAAVEVNDLAPAR
jgi:guanylate kinase